jgi:hypothetical protein
MKSPKELLSCTRLTIQPSLSSSKRLEKRRRDQESKGEKKDRRKIKAAIRKEKRKLKKVNKMAKQDQPEVEADEPNP